MLNILIILPVLLTVFVVWSMPVAEFCIFLFIAMSMEHFGQTFASQTMITSEAVRKLVVTT